MAPDKDYTLLEVAELLRITVRDVRALIRSGKLQCMTYGPHRRRVSEAQLNACRERMSAPQISKKPKLSLVKSVAQRPRAKLQSPHVKSSEGSVLSAKGIRKLWQ